MVAGALAILCIYVSFMGVLFLLPQYLQYVQDRSVVTAGRGARAAGPGGRHRRAVQRASLRRAGGPRDAGGRAAWGHRRGDRAAVAALPATPRIAIVLAATGLLGLLISLTVPPATAVIMNDLGDEKAGDGGAVNQLARQVGGALGVAVIGTVFAAVYSDRIDSLSGLSAAQRDRAAESIEEARDVVHAGEARAASRALLARVDDAFDVAARTGFGVCVGVLFSPPWWPRSPCRPGAPEPRNRARRSPARTSRCRRGRRRTRTGPTGSPAARSRRRRWRPAGPSGLDVVYHDLETLQGPWRHVGEPGPDRDRARGSRGSEWTKRIASLTRWS